MNNIIDLIGQDKEITTLTDIVYHTFPLKDFGSLREIRAFLHKNGGIYSWFDSETRKIYIGSSKNLWRRFLSYKNSFFYGKTKRVNIKLLHRVEKVGIKNIKFFVLELFNKEELELRKLEQEYLDKCLPFGKNGFNIRKSTIVYKPKLLPQEVIDKIIETHTGENSSNAILTNDAVLLIKKQLISGVKLKPISKEFKVSTTVISNIKRGLTWSHIKLSEKEEEQLKLLVERDKRLNLPRELIKSIKRDIKSGIKMNLLAKKYNLGYTCITGLKYGSFYKEINP